MDTTCMAKRPDPRRWLALVATLLAAAMDLIGATIVNVAIPSVQRDLGAGPGAMEWTIAGYALAFGVLLIMRETRRCVRAPAVVPGRRRRLHGGIQGESP